MKNIFTIGFLLFLISCNKSTYYAFKEDSTYSYCTIEITKKKEVIYRASSANYFDKSKFVFISSLNDNYSPNIINDTIGLESMFLEMFYIDRKYPINFGAGLVQNKYPSELYINFVKGKNDTINTKYFLDNLLQETSLQKAGIKWFPPYLVKVKKIDYSIFPKEIQHMNLKNPRRQKNDINK